MALASWGVWAFPKIEAWHAEPFRTVALWLCIAAIAIGVNAACLQVLRELVALRARTAAAQQAATRHFPG